MNETQNFQDMISSLESQLIDMYAEKELHGDASGLRASLESLESQLCDLYENDQSLVISRLEAQVESLNKSKHELESRLELFTSEIQKIKLKSREMGAALFEAALFNSFAGTERT